jgi:hypothetical protein
MRCTGYLAALAAALWCTRSLAEEAQRAADLKAPVRIEAAGAPIDTEVGHAAPEFTDLDGDGLRDLLVGQFGGGKLRIYRNIGSNSAPAFGEHEWFTAGGVEGTIPSG